MAPKKQKGGGKAPSKPKGHTVDSRSAPKLQISAENERRLRRLLLNTERPPLEVATAANSLDVSTTSVTRGQKTRRIRGVYDRLSLEGFTSDQIEQALSALKEGATFEIALDWLCLNIPGNELPLKFSSGVASSTKEEDRSVRIISTARADWVPTQRPIDELKEGTFGLSVRFKGQHDESSLDFGKSSQAVWIRQYLEQEEKEDEDKEKEVDPYSRADSVAKEYRLARLGALEAKQKRNKMNQKKYNEIISKLKQELTSLGLSEKDLESELHNEIANLKMQEMSRCSPENPSHESKPSDDAKFDRETVSASIVDSSHFEELNHIVGSPIHSVPDECRQKKEPEELKLDSLILLEVDPYSRAESVAKEYHLARLTALEAKQKGNETNQKKYNAIISKLKQELISLGLSEKDLESELHYEVASLKQEMPSGSPENLSFESKQSDDAKFEGETMGASIVGSSHFEELNHIVGSSNHSVPDVCEQKEEPEELELDNLFSEDCSYGGTLSSEALKHQKKEKFVDPEYQHILGNIDEIWKKGDPAKIPKAVLQKLCQRLGWEAPKYNRVSTKENKFVYSVSILRTASGRGKSRKAGGLINFHYPNQDEAFRSTEEAQNKIAAFVLYQLIPSLPFAQLLIEPYASFIRERLEEDEFLERVEDNENSRRVRFVDSLLDGVSKPRASKDVKDESISTEMLVDPSNRDGERNFLFENTKMTSLEGLSYHEQRESKLLKEELQNKMKNPKYVAMLETRAALPIAKLHDKLLQLFNDNDVIIVSGETGSGKTTQVPQFILDDMIKSGLGGVCNIICTQPRRIAAMSVAERVSDERCESSPGGDGSLVGYQVRLDSVRNEKTKLLFCTTGILLRKLASNCDLIGVTHVIVDEVHERSLLGDFLLIVLKNIIKRQPSCSRRRSNLKVVLMSATFDSSLFSKYFGHCPVITAEGRTHPVSVSYIEDIYEKLEYLLPSDSNVSGATLISNRGRRTGKNSADNRRGKKNLIMSSWGDETSVYEDYVNPYYISDLYHPYSERTQQNLKSLNEDVIDFDLLEDLIYHIDETYPPGAILVFLPGVPEIELLVNKLAASFQFRGLSSDWVLPLHSSLSSMEQRKVFLSPPENTRKVIIATDIAETSITIDDVIYVVDSGKHNESRFNPHKKMSSMVEEWISQANAKQRRGRAGRVKPGICFCLYTLHRFKKLMRPYQVPEMLRMPLTDLCLQIKFLSLGDIKCFLSEAIEAPSEEAISSAVDLLYKVGAFEGNEELSPLGYHLAKLPVDVLIGKMILHGAIFGCLSPILSIAAFLSHKSPFLNPKDEKYNAMRARSTLLTYNLDGGTAFDESKKQSDHLLLVIAYNRWARILHENGSNAAQQFCRSFFLNSSVMHTIRDMRIQFGSLLADIGLITLPRRYQIDGKRKEKLESWLSDMKQPFNIHALHSAVIKSILCAGLYPNVAAAIEGTIGLPLGSNTSTSNSMSTADRALWFDGKREVHIHPSSLNHSIKDSEYPFLVFLEKVETSKVFLRDTSIISPYSLLLFGGSISVQHQMGVVIIDGWLKLTAPAQIAVLFKELRLTLHAVLKDLIRKPEVMTVSNNEVVKTIINLLLEENASHSS